MAILRLKELTGIDENIKDAIYNFFGLLSNADQLVLCLYFMSERIYPHTDGFPHFKDIYDNLNILDEDRAEYFRLEKYLAMRSTFNAKSNKDKLIWKNINRKGLWKNTDDGNEDALKVLSRWGVELKLRKRLLKPSSQMLTIENKINPPPDMKKLFGLNWKNDVELLEKVENNKVEEAELDEESRAKISKIKKEVERMAIDIVVCKLKDNWDVQSKEREKLGYDLYCTRLDNPKKILFIEVKGKSGQDNSFIITKNEWAKAQQDPKCFYLAVVTSALTEKPKIEWFRGNQLEEKFDFEPLAYVAKPKLVESC